MQTIRVLVKALPRFLSGQLPISIRDEFPTQRNLLASVFGLSDLLARF